MSGCRRSRSGIIAALFFAGAGCMFAQNAEADTPDPIIQRGSIPEELLRPRREEAPRYPVDTVIGELGQGKAPAGAYRLARAIAAALLAGTIDAPSLSPVNKIFLESYMNALDVINPRIFRLGSGREEPDGSVSFLVRFAGREQGITGELFVRLDEQRSQAPSPESDAQPEPAWEDGMEAELQPEPAEDDYFAEWTEEAEWIEEAEWTEEAEQAPVVSGFAERGWVFEELILEEARSREMENAEERRRFDFSPYERFF